MTDDQNLPIDPLEDRAQFCFLRGMDEVHPCESASQMGGEIRMIAAVL
jgi:hypothetical protein